MSDQRSDLLSVQTTEGEPPFAPDPDAQSVVPSTAVTPDSVSTKGNTIVPRRRFQRGSIVVKSGRYYGVFREDILQSDGTFARKLLWVSLGLMKEMSRRAAWKAFQPYLDRTNTEAKMPPKSGMTPETFLKEWSANVAVNLKGSTTRAAELLLRAHTIPKLGSLPMTAINTKTIQSFVAYLATGGRSRKTVENVLLTLSSILRVARSWDHACGSFKLADITMPREGIKKEQRCLTDEEMGKIIAAAPEPFGTILAVRSVRSRASHR